MSLANDILSGPVPMVLGEGWYPLERSSDSLFRWVRNDCIVSIAAFHPYDHRVTIELESGPGLGKAPFVLEIYEEDKQLFRFDVAGRQSISFILPAGKPKISVLRMHIEGGGDPSPDDDRTLNFRVFGISTRAQRPDVVPPGSGIRVGAGWYNLEQFGDQTFRWVNNEAFVEVERAGLGSVSFEVEPGPGVDFKAFTLVAIDSKDGRELASFQIASREIIRIPLDAYADRPGAFQLVVRGGGRLSNGDARILNFRAFSIAR